MQNVPRTSSVSHVKSRDPEVSSQVQIALKESIPGPLGFLGSVLADGGLMDPGKFEYNDQYTFEEAGSPIDGEIFIPLSRWHW